MRDTGTATKIQFFFWQNFGKKKKQTHKNIFLQLKYHYLLMKKSPLSIMPRLERIYNDACTAATSLLFIPDLAVLTLKSIAMFHGFN